MIRLPGLVKVAAVLVLDFSALFALFDNLPVAAAVTGAMTLYVWLGGYLALWKERAVRWDRLPAYEHARLSGAKQQLVQDVKDASAADLSGLRLYLVPDESLNATAYGGNCISVTRGTLDNTAPVTLNAVLTHEASHTLQCDPEWNRALFCSISLLVGALSVLSAVFLVLFFLLFLLLRCFRSWLGIMAFQGTAKVVRGFFHLIQRGIVTAFHTLLGLASRHAEYRCDLYACRLGYGLQLAHFLALAAPESHRQGTLTEALYRSHPPTAKRIARLETYLAKTAGNGSIQEDHAQI